MALALSAADTAGIFIATDSGGGTADEREVLNSGLLRCLGSGIAVATVRRVASDVWNSIAGAGWGSTVFPDAAREFFGRWNAVRDPDGGIIPALVCGFDDRNQAHCVTIGEADLSSVPEISSQTKLSPGTILGIGAHRGVAVPRVHEWLERGLGLPWALKCGLKAAATFDEVHVFNPNERKIQLPLLVHCLPPAGQLVRVF